MLFVQRDRDVDVGTAFMLSMDLAVIKSIIYVFIEGALRRNEEGIVSRILWSK